MAGSHSVLTPQECASSKTGIKGSAAGGTTGFVGARSACCRLSSTSSASNRASSLASSSSSVFLAATTTVMRPDVMTESAMFFVALDLSRVL